MLSEIVALRKRQLAEAMSRKPLSALLEWVPESPTPSIEESLSRDAVNIIAEIKYRSPSRGDFPCRMPAQELAQTYFENGASAISVVTEPSYFKGELESLQAVREACPKLPALRKDFIIDRYQVAEARAYGASAFLLIVACLGDQTKQLVSYGEELEMTPLVEVHDPYELEVAVESGARIVGVNNRNLRTFEVDIQTSFELARRLEGESGLLLVSESGLRERSQLLELRDAGFSGFLIGSLFMESRDPGAELAQLLGSG